MQIYPVSAAVPIDLKFFHIAIVDPTDTAVVDVRYSGDTSWHAIARYNFMSDEAWSDTSADAGDWTGERLVIAHPSPGSGATATVRFRLRTGALRNSDGWYVDDIDFGTISGVDDRSSGSSGLSASTWPNPFSEAAVIAYRLPYAGAVSVTIYDALGRVVARPVDGRIESGEGRTTFAGAGRPDGVYFYEIRHPAGVVRGSMVLARGTRQ
jgi:hypothetical protein